MKNAIQGIAKKIVDNRAVIIRNTVIIAGSVVGLVLAAGFSAKAVDAAQDSIEPTPADD